MTVTSEVSVRFDGVPLHRRTARHPFQGRRPRHRRRATGIERIVGAGVLHGILAGPRRRRLRTSGSSSRDFRAGGIVLAAVAWTGCVAGHLAGAPQATALFAALDVLTWGQALAAIVPTEDGLEFSTVSVATSAAVLVLVGMLLVELRLTGAFLWLFLGLGALSLFVQIISFSVHRAPSGARFVPPQRVPSIIDGRVVLEDR